jgi:hypothetical protein
MELFWDVIEEYEKDGFRGYLYDSRFNQADSRPFAQTKVWPTREFALGELIGLAEQRSGQLRPLGLLYSKNRRRWLDWEPEILQV